MSERERSDRALFVMRSADPWPDEYQLSTGEVRDVAVLSRLQGAIGICQHILRELPDIETRAAWAHGPKDVLAAFNEQYRAVKATIDRIEAGDAADQWKPGA